MTPRAGEVPSSTVKAVERIGLGPVFALLLLAMLGGQSYASARDWREERAALSDAIRENAKATSVLSREVAAAMQRGRALCLNANDATGAHP